MLPPEPSVTPLFGVPGLIVRLVSVLLLLTKLRLLLQLLVKLLVHLLMVMPFWVIRLLKARVFARTVLLPEDEDELVDIEIAFLDEWSFASNISSEVDGILVDAVVDDDVEDSWDGNLVVVIIVGMAVAVVAKTAPSVAVVMVNGELKEVDAGVEALGMPGYGEPGSCNVDDEDGDDKGDSVNGDWVGVDIKRFDVGDGDGGGVGTGDNGGELASRLLTSESVMSSVIFSVSPGKHGSSKKKAVRVGR